jgi:hypothetical protein
METVNIKVGANDRLLLQQLVISYHSLGKTVPVIPY